MTEPHLNQTSDVPSQPADSRAAGLAAGFAKLSLTASDGNRSGFSASVAINVKSAAEQAADLQAQVSALQADGVLNRWQARLLTTLNLQGNSGDDLRVAAFLLEVRVLRGVGILTQEQADALLGPGHILLLSV